MKKNKPTIRRGHITEYVETDQLVVAVEVPLIYAPEEPDEALIEAKTIRFLDEVSRRAKAGDRKWLKKVGRIFEPAAA